MKKIPKISWKGKGYFRWDKRVSLDCTLTIVQGYFIYFIWQIVL